MPSTRCKAAVRPRERSLGGGPGGQRPIRCPVPSASADRRRRVGRSASRKSFRRKPPSSRGRSPDLQIGEPAVPVPAAAPRRRSPWSLFCAMASLQPGSPRPPRFVCRRPSAAHRLGDTRLGYAPLGALMVLCRHRPLQKRVGALPARWRARSRPRRAMPKWRWERGRSPPSRLPHRRRAAEPKGSARVSDRCAHRRCVGEAPAATGAGIACRRGAVDVAVLVAWLVGVLVAATATPYVPR